MAEETKKLYTLTDTDRELLIVTLKGMKSRLNKLDIGDQMVLEFGIWHGLYILERMEK